MGVTERIIYEISKNYFEKFDFLNQKIEFIINTIIKYESKDYIIKINIYNDKNSDKIIDTISLKITYTDNELTLMLKCIGLENKLKKRFITSLGNHILKRSLS